jgi:excisionase family DNA binding protein
MRNELLTLTEVADRLKVSYDTARRLCKSGRLPYVPVGCGEDHETIRVRGDTLEEFTKNERRGGSAKVELARVRETLNAIAAVEEHY